MDRDYSDLDAFLSAGGYDGFLLDADGDDSDQRYLSGFDAPDPFVALYDGAVHVLVPALEYGRARRESAADSLSRLADYDGQRLVAEHGAHEGRARALAAFLDDHGVSSVAVPPRFPLASADTLRGQGVSVSADGGDVVSELRAVKTPEELGHVRAVQRANEAAIRAAEDLLSTARIEDGRLYHDGEPLTSEQVAETIEVTLLRHGCTLADTIVAGGADAADPHERGSGPLRVDEPVVVDVFPRSKTTGYHADTTRTFLVGDPSPTVREWFAVVDEARRAALAAVEPGATGADVHAAACDVIEDAGHPTLRSDPSTETGFIHSTGHGVGLDVHELPSVGPSGGELEAGHVLTVEPGLYDPEVGGVRIEDIVVVTEDGSENLTDYPVDLVVG
jgi:Xaa-Pro aminopeptidase